MTTDAAVSLARAFIAEHPAADADLRLFGQFAGSWDLDCREFADDGSVTVLRGEWHFGYALGGYATSDVWILPGVEHGVSVRFPDPSAGDGVWRSTWVGPGRGRVHSFIAQQDGDHIVLDGGDLRWTFFAIGLRDGRPESFSWRNEARGDGGMWRIQQEFSVWRHR